MSGGVFSCMKMCVVCICVHRRTDIEPILPLYSLRFGKKEEEERQRRGRDREWEIIKNHFCIVINLCSIFRLHATQIKVKLECPVIIIIMIAAVQVWVSTALSQICLIFILRFSLRNCRKKVHVQPKWHVIMWCAFWMMGNFMDQWEWSISTDKEMKQME